MTAVLAAADIECFRNLVAKHLGLHFEDGKLDFLADVLRRHMARTGCDHFSSFYQRLVSCTSESAETRALAEELTVCETYFFRYADHFRALTEMVVPDRIRARAHCRQLRILSAGCASGEEAYSVAMLILEQLPDLASWEVSIQGIDINTSMLQRALRGRYTAWSLRETSDDFRTKYFHSEGKDFLLDGAVRSAVTFEERTPR